jgi:hypothetical protein
MAGLVPAIPMLKSAAPSCIGITGTRPVMTEEVMIRSGLESLTIIQPLAAPEIMA